MHIYIYNTCTREHTRTYTHTHIICINGLYRQKRDTCVSRVCICSCVYVCVYVPVCMCVCTRTCMFVCVCVVVQIPMYTYSCIRIQESMRSGHMNSVHIHANTHMHRYVHLHTGVLIGRPTFWIYTYEHSYIKECTNIYRNCNTRAHEPDLCI